MVRIFGKDISIPGLPPRLGINIVESKWFEKQCRRAFNECDVDRDGALDNKEIYIGLLKLYDLINRKLPYHVRVPSIEEFLHCCRGLVGHHKDWKDSLFLKIGLAVLLKALGFPYLAGLIKQGASQLGITAVKGLSSRLQGCDYHASSARTPYP
ncbi:hypothetical protein VOLCADRAFT_99232 [Volvox carteri f. nagariensis]|uniref:EF-hand domain-containing protein n=1 Tax=Volvox carteri f. nagariensis TaxID=3068 RepID=D8UHA3_VOLCA|nr:uncharacterized protein VOLCADRAFT_99232 [Volvox carteri f. nagariensis]EFJ40896.1 hypothetical protein VOLCADRAFT_99232 [Volvox carteri f. nagariensis]|eukprot:XP_002958056.1 hypothetical protein VOLCADRAFT_99232 [Volvox carteri f. nagariensis]